MSERAPAGATDHAVPGRQLPSCFIVDDDRAVRQVMRLALSGTAIECQEFPDVPSMLAALGAGMPELIIMDISLSGSDAVEGIRGLAERNYRGILQIVSGLDAKIIEDVSHIGARHGLRMMPAMRKPFRANALNRLVRELADGAAIPRSDPLPGSAAPEWHREQVSLEQLLRSNRLELWYQPKFDLIRMRLAGAEGLVRGTDPDHGLLLPGAFLPGADERGMLKLTERVLLDALADWQEFSDAGFPLQLSINVPVEALFKLPISMLVRENRPPDPGWPGLILEVTEDQAVRDIPLAQEVATQLRIYNVVLAIDDFGTGYSHLSRLRELPFAELKLDRALVAGCGSDPTSAALCKSAIDMAHRFGSVAVGEGIEKASELQALYRFGCDLGQGYLLAQPQPKRRLLAMLGNRPV
jgi:EAL domain-containing protein (putative c-di-GMP-specific phosphodiesterase class I)